MSKFVNMNSTAKKNMGSSAYKTKGTNSKTGSPVKQMANILKESHSIQV